jgi:signal transduction histidine kinase
MNQHLQTILNFIQQAKHLSAEEKTFLTKSVQDTESELTVSEFKLEKTIEELDQKSKTVRIQNRELEIEAALERVRAQSMAMHHPDDLDKVNKELLSQLKWLQIQGLTGVTFYLIDENGWVKAWDFSSPGNTGDQSSYTLQFDSNKHEMLGFPFKTLLQTDLDYFVADYPLEKLEKAVYEFEEIDPAIAKIVREALSTGILTHQWTACCRISNGLLGIDLVSPPSADTKAIVLKMASAFNQAYTRFLDLQKAEAQVREAEIELALERVRARTMAMHSSSELLEVATVLFQQVKALGVPQWNCGFNIWKKGDTEFTYYPGSPDGVIFPSPCKIPLKEHPVFRKFDESRNRGDELFIYEKDGEIQADHYAYMLSLPDVGDLLQSMLDAGFELPTFQIDHLANFAYGNLIFITYQHYPEMHEVFKRFAKVFEQTYTRFLDLQKAEAQAREAQIEFALEKVRSRTLAMQNSYELAETSVVVFKQLIHLGIEPNRLFIGIIKDETDTIEAWATNEDGTKIGNHFTLNIEKNKSVKKMYEGWKHKKASITIEMEGTELQNYFHYLADEMKIPFKGGLSQKRRVQTIAYFGQGLIGMASPDDQPEATARLLERFAAVFNLTYTRFNDLKIAEAHALKAEEDLIKLHSEKRRAEEALSELKETQKQLIQSEKMASLGELTAGIAHEIQNPLNFVNNFSEVSSELLDEMNEELNKGDIEEAKVISADIRQNLEKINYHGKRADAIVKGMLQHSRSSSGIKEPTDINKLADEYLRLAYHGLRAKDKSFNATIKTDYDETIGKINIIPQDMGRVILNLITNSFYATNEKQKSPLIREDGITYEPTVTVLTKRVGNTVEVTVKDNGNGIPQKVLDKIFQPFFTTKPTGKGTGLGLSLVYDIVKAHGGEIKVNSEQSKGTDFTIILLITT